MTLPKISSLFVAAFVATGMLPGAQSQNEWIKYARCVDDECVFSAFTDCKSGEDVVNGEVFRWCVEE